MKDYFFVINAVAPVPVAAPYVINIVAVNAAAGLSLLTNIRLGGWKGLTVPNTGLTLPTNIRLGWK